MNGEVSLVVAGGAGDDEAEESFSEAGEVVVVLHAVCGQGGRVNSNTEAVVHIEGVHTGAVERDGEDIPLYGCFRDIHEASGCRATFL